MKKETYTKDKCKEFAKKMMDDIAFDNGAVDSKHQMKYPQKKVDEIANKSYVFFNENPSLATDKVMEEICIGCWEDNQEKYGKKKGYKELDAVLDKYFDSI